MARYKISPKEISIYEYTPDRSTFSGYSETFSCSISIEELKDSMAKQGYRLTIEKIEDCPTTSNS